MSTVESRLPLALAIVALSTIALTACAQGGGSLKPEDSPLSEYLSAGYDRDASPKEQERRAKEQQKKQEALTADCMAKEGFEYKPFTGNMSFASSEDVKWEPEERSWVEKYGYGAVDNPMSQQMKGKEPEQPVEDPNQEYQQSLSEAERQAYQETLYGKMADPDPQEDGPVEWKWEDAGCQGWAQHEVSADQPWQSDEFKPLVDRIQKFYEKMQDGSELKKLDGAWAACMGDAGESGFRKQQEAQQSIYDAMNKLYEQQAPMDPEQDPSAYQDPADSAEMKKLGETERALALKDLTCREKTSYRDAQLKIQFASEEKFVADNKKELEAFKVAGEKALAQEKKK